MEEARIKLKKKYYKNILKDYEKYLNELNEILDTDNELNKYKYNLDHEKLKKHFPLINIPIIHFKKAEEFFINCEKKYKNNLSVSLISGDIKSQIKIIRDTINRRYNSVKIFDSLIEKKVEEEYKLERYNLKLFSINTNKEGIIYYEREKLKKNFPEFYNQKEDRLYYKYIYSIETEDFHNYCDLKHLKMCDRILICIDEKNIYNIMFKTSENLKLDNIPKKYFKEYISSKFNFYL